MKLVKLNKGQLINITAEYIDMVFYGTFKVLQGFEIEMSVGDGDNNYSPSMHAPEGHHCEDYINLLTESGKIERVDIQEISIGFA